MQKIVTLSLAVLALGVGSPARADGGPDAAVDTHTSPVIDVELAGMIAPDGPAGDAGAELQVGIGPSFAIAIGAGGELFGSPQAAIQARARLPLGAFTLYAGLGGARGLLRQGGDFFHFCGDDSGCSDPPTPPPSSVPADFATAELGVEAHVSALFARAFAGDKVLLDPGAACGYEQDCRAQRPYAGLAAGVRF